MRYAAAWLLSIFISAASVAGEVPPVQMLVPGFTVHEMPVKVSNINNVRYRPDGKLLALGYDGRLHLLMDTDGDGLARLGRPGVATG